MRTHLSQCFDSAWLGFKGFRRNEAGTTVVAFAISAVALTGVVGIAVDSAVWYKTQTELFAAADAAALAAASALATARTSSSPSESVAIAKNTAASFVKAKLGSVATPVVTVDEAAGKVAVALSQPGHSMFTSVFGAEDIDISVVSEAVAGVDYNGRACIIALDPNATVGIDFSLGGQVVAHDCAIWSNATSASSIDANGSGLVQASATCAVGGITSGSLDIRPTARSGCAPVLDPLASWNPPLFGGCNHSNLTFNSGSVTLTPGVYCGGIKVSGSVQITLQPGLYVLLDGGIKVNGGASIEGAGVTLLTMGSDAAVNMLGSALVRLSAPSTGDTAGLVIASARGQPVVTSKIGGGAQVQIVGSVYLPTHDLGYGGNSEVSQPAGFTVLIGRTIKFHGGAQVEVRSDYQNTAGIPAFPGQVFLIGTTRLVR